MEITTTNHKNYENHRNNQRERILEGAEKLFVRDGINKVTMSAIAKAARMARITVYEYFPDKEEIAWAIYQKLIQETYPLERFLKADGNGFERIEHLMLQMVNLPETDSEHTRFFVEFNSLYAKRGDTARLLKLDDKGSRGALTQLIRDGIADGSIRADLDPDLMEAAIANLITGMSDRFALMGHLISQEAGQPWTSIYLEIIRAFLRGIQLSPS